MGRRLGLGWLSFHPFEVQSSVLFGVKGADMSNFGRGLYGPIGVVVTLAVAQEVAAQGSITFTPFSPLAAVPVPALGGTGLLLLALLLAFIAWRYRRSVPGGSLWSVVLLAGAVLSAGSGVGLIGSASAISGIPITDPNNPSTYELADGSVNVFINSSGIGQRVSDLTLPGSCPSASVPVEGVDVACNLNAELADGNSCSVDCRSAPVNVGPGQVLRVDGTPVDVELVPCGEGVNGCTAAAARQACQDLGMRVVSHASDGSNTVYSLGATNSCQWSISYFNVDQALPDGACLAGVSNLDWSSCCELNGWHGNTVPIPAPGTVFGYVDSSNSGYFPDLPNQSGERWGCYPLAFPATSDVGCSSLYVACTAGTDVVGP